MVSTEFDKTGHAHYKIGRRNKKKYNININGCSEVNQNNFKQNVNLNLSLFHCDRFTQEAKKMPYKTKY